MTDPTTETDEQRADREETERDHASGNHEYCGVTCEAEFPTEMLRNGILAKGYPGTAGMLDELLRRAAVPVVPPADLAAEGIRDELLHTIDFNLAASLGYATPEGLLAVDDAALTSERDRYRTAWQSARQRAQAYGEGILRHVADRDYWKGQYKAAWAQQPADRAGLRDRIAEAIWEQQNPGRRWADCEYRWRADAEEDADAVLAVLPRPAAPDGLRARIADVLAHADGHRWADGYDRRLSPAYQRYLGWADQVLAALPTTDQAAARAAALREVADFYERVLEQSLNLSSDPRYYTAVRDVVMGLRRRADEEAQQQPATEAHPPRHSWRVETRDSLADEWAPGSRFASRPHAVERYETATRNAPLWRDGTPVERRIVRETTTYTVETDQQPELPSVVSQPGKDTTQAQQDGAQEAPPVEPHPTPADLDAALTILDSVHSQDTTTAADEAQQDGCWCRHPEDRHWTSPVMPFGYGCHDCPGWDSAHPYGQELPWLPEGDGAQQDGEQQ